MKNANKTLLVGHCGFDSSRIQDALAKAGAGGVDSADSISEALTMLEEKKYALVLGNRVIAGAEEGGLNLVKSVRKNSEFGQTPVMVLSAFKETQQAVLAEGGEQGFGKDLLESEAAVTGFSRYFVK